MEWLATILTSPYSLYTIVGLVVLVIIIGFFAKKGIFSLNKWGMTVGNAAANEEQFIIRTQIEWVQSDCIDLLRDISCMPEAKNMDIYKGKYTIERVFDEFVKIIIFNHIQLEPTYIQLRQDTIWGVVAGINPEAKWNFLEPIIKERVKAAIEKLYYIRNNKEK